MADEESTGVSVSLTLRLPSGDKRTIIVNSEETLLQLKERVASIASISSAEAVRLIDTGRVLKGDELTISALGVRSGTTLHVSKQTVEQVATSGTSVPVTSARTPGGGLMPDGARELLNNPFVSAMLEDPTFMQAILQSDPRFQQMAENNPELRQLMTDRSFLQQMSSAIRNPAVMQEMMRNHDRSLSNIESYPGGMSALSSMYHSLQQEEGALSDRPVTTEESNRLFAERLGATTSSTERLNQSALPNPWASTPTQASPTTPSASGMPTRQSQSSAHNAASINPYAAMLSGYGPAGANAAEANLDPFAAMLSSLGSAGTTASNAGTANSDPFAALLSSLGSAAPTNSSPFAAGNLSSTFLNPAATASSPGTGVAPEDQYAALFAQLQNLRELENSLGAFSPFGASPLAAAAAPATATTVAAQPQPTEPKESPEEKFKEQLQNMSEMGFTDKPKNIRALLAAGGNTESAIIYLLESLDQ
ncbi:hypothetical protein BC829DRAFT_52896 [Chytridium lagenaria]|nr:hypothetical protein BC829DRAFT_52896 [Chytridium lagenaria]